MRSPLVALGAICLGGAAVRLAFFAGLVLSDDVFYVERAFELAQGDFVPPRSHWAARIGLVAPTALAYALFGVSKWTTPVLPLLCSLAAPVAAFAFGRSFFGVRVGLWSAFLIACLPLDIIFASELFGTTPVLLLSGLAYLSFLRAEETRRPALYGAAGGLLGAAYLVHETALLVLAVLPAYALCVRAPTRRQLWCCVGLFAVLALEVAINAALGDPWARVTAMLRPATVQGVSADVADKGWNAVWIVRPLLRALSEQELGLFPWLLAPVVLLRLGPSASPRERALALWVVCVFLWITYGTVSPFTYAPLARLPRYLAPIALPAALLLAHELVERRPPWLRRGAAVALASSSLLCVATDRGRSVLVPFEELRDVIQRTGVRVVSVEPSLRFPVWFVVGADPRFRIEVLEDGAPARSGVAVVRDAEWRERFRGVPGAHAIAEIPPPDTLHGRLLRNPAMLRLLAATRSDFRMAGLVHRREAPLTLIGIP